MHLLPSFLDQLEDLYTVKHKLIPRPVNESDPNGSAAEPSPVLANRSSSRENITMSAFTPHSDLPNPPLEQTEMTAGFVNQGPAMIHQQQATLHPQQFNAPYNLPTPSGSQLSEIRAVNGVFHLRWTNRLPNGAAHLRPQGPPQLLNQPQLSQVLLWNDQGPAELSGPPQHQRGSEAEFTPPTQVLESSMVERPEEVEGQHQQPTHVQTVPNVVANSMVQTPSMLPRFPPVQLEELTAGVNTTPSDGNSQQGKPEKYACKRRATSAQGHAPGESSRKPSKRQRNSTNSNDQEVFVPFYPREVINGCYNPIYNEMGLPLDPHLRLLEASLETEFPFE